MLKFQNFPGFSKPEVLEQGAILNEDWKASTPITANFE